MTQEATNQQTEIAVPMERSVEFQAFGSSETVKLSIEIVRRWIAKPTKSGKQASDGDIMKFIMLCKARQLNPWEGDAFLTGYDTQGGAEFSLITAHQAFLKRAEAHGQYNGMRSGVIVADKSGNILELEGDFFLQDQTLLGGWCDVYRKDHEHPKKARLKLTTFDKGFAQWKVNPAGMIVKCAEADALRGSFPNTLGGMYNDAEMAITTHPDIVVAAATKTGIGGVKERLGLTPKSSLDVLPTEPQAEPVAEETVQADAEIVAEPVEESETDADGSALIDLRTAVKDLLTEKVGGMASDQKKFLKGRVIDNEDAETLKEMLKDLTAM